MAPPVCVVKNKESSCKGQHSENFHCKRLSLQQLTLVRTATLRLKSNDGLWFLQLITNILEFVDDLIVTWEAVRNPNTLFTSTEQL